jgi:hypothetical protein
VKKKKHYAVQHDEWTGVAWLRRTSHPMTEDEACEHYLSRKGQYALRNLAIIDLQELSTSLELTR